MIQEEYERKLIIYGRVQGVGFRPFVAEQAEELGVFGTVQNMGGIVRISARGTKEALDELVHRLFLRPPKGARVDRIEVEEEKPKSVGVDRIEVEREAALDCSPWEAEGKHRFQIIESEPQEDLLRFLPPDIATCDSCVEELLDKKNRRYRYPFISCTACGPRFSIMEDLPYDRDTISMRDFAMCPDCEAEYRSPGNLRRHAQTIACADCGPALVLYQKATPIQLRGEAALSQGMRLLKGGNILAIKDIGGYHFAFDPGNENAARRLREFKNRERKPFAVMFPDMEAVREYCEVSKKEEELLLGDARPIVLLTKRKNRDFAPSVCGNSLRIGALLPCNPLQHLILWETGPLVMTSGNLGGEPILTEDEDMRKLMQKGMPDAILAHDRRIVSGLDDSIYQVTKCGDREIVQIIRRARGLVPEPVEMPAELWCDTFAAGGDLKAVFALGRKNMVYLSGHFGDLEDFLARQKWEAAIGAMGRLLGILPVRAVSDLHPLYYSGKYAGQVMQEPVDRTQKPAGRKTEQVQHHHAHIAAVMAEHSLQGQVIGVAYDGTGYGLDGTIWGGELLLCEGAQFRRCGHLQSVPLCGGDASAKNAAALAVCYLDQAVRQGAITREWLDLQIEQGFLPVNQGEYRLIMAALEHQVQTVRSSSMGRLFDAAAAVLGICSCNSYEGECPAALQACAERYLLEQDPAAVADMGLCVELTLEQGVWIADSAGLMAELAKRRLAGVEAGALAYGFHAAVARLTLEFCRKLRASQRIETGRDLTTVALGGGSMYNGLLLRLMIPALEEDGFRVYCNEKVPCGDGGLAFGQMYLAVLMNNR